MPEADVDTNIEALEEASKAKTDEVTYAIADTHIDDKRPHEGDIMGIGDQKVTVDRSLKGDKDRATIDEESELISLYFETGRFGRRCGKFAQKWKKLYPDVDVDVYTHGRTAIVYIALRRITEQNFYNN